MSLIVVDKVSKRFDAASLWRPKQGSLAVSGVSLTVLPGQTLGIVGESGSGKSTLLRMMLRLTKPSTGAIQYQGRDVWQLAGNDLLRFRREVQPIFQDPASSFNPRQKIGTLLVAPLEVHGIGDRQRRAEMIAETLALMGLPADYVNRYPHQLSGGQKQRVAIARAVILKPSLILADEPTSALDVSVQAQILNLFRDTKQKLGLTIVFVSHNLAVIRYLSDTVAVMKQGEIVEFGPSETVFSNPQHPYTRMLLAAVPHPRRQPASASTQE